MIPAAAAAAATRRTALAGTRSARSSGRHVLLGPTPSTPHRGRATEACPMSSRSRNRSRMPAQAQRHVDVDSVRTQRQILQRFGQHDRHVHTCALQQPLPLERLQLVRPGSAPRAACVPHKLRAPNNLMWPFWCSSQTGWFSTFMAFRIGAGTSSRPCGSSSASPPRSFAVNSRSSPSSVSSPGRNQCRYHLLPNGDRIDTTYALVEARHENFCGADLRQISVEVGWQFQAAFVVNTGGVDPAGMLHRPEIDGIDHFLPFGPLWTTDADCHTSSV